MRPFPVIGFGAPGRPERASARWVKPDAAFDEVCQILNARHP